MNLFLSLMRTRVYRQVCVSASTSCPRHLLNLLHQNEPSLSGKSISSSVKHLHEFNSFFCCIELDYRFNKDADGSLGILIARGIRGGIYLMGINPNGPAHRQTSLQPGTVQHLIKRIGNFDLSVAIAIFGLMKLHSNINNAAQVRASSHRSAKRERRSRWAFIPSNPMNR